MAAPTSISMVKSSEGSVEKVPPEILCMIFDYISTCDCPEDCDVAPTCKCARGRILANAFNLRLCSKYLAAIGARNIFKTLHLSYRRKSFENLNNVSLNPLFRKYVKYIVYEGDELPLLTRKDWERSIPIPAHVFPAQYDYDLPEAEMYDDFAAQRHWRERTMGPRLMYTEEQLNRGYKRFQEEVEINKNQMILTKFDYGILENALKRFPRLEEVKIMVKVTDRHSEDLRAAFKDTLIFPHKFVAQRGARTPIVDNFKLDWRQPGWRQVESMLQGIAAADVKLKSLSCGYIGWNFFHVWHPYGHQPLDRCLPAFTHLTRLDLFIDARGSCRLEVADYGRKSLLGKAVGMARGLTSLTLRFGLGFWDHTHHWELIDYFEGGLETMTLDDIASDTTWPLLQELSLTTVATSEDFLVDFMRRHSKTLISLNLGEMMLIKGGSWQTTFQRIKKVVDKSRKLQVAEFSRCFLTFEDESGDSREDFVLNMDQSNQDFVLNMHKSNVHTSFIDGHPLGPMKELPKIDRFGSKVGEYLTKDGEDPFYLLDEDFKAATGYFEDMMMDGPFGKETLYNREDVRSENSYNEELDFEDSPEWEDMKEDGFEQEENVGDESAAERHAEMVRSQIAVRAWMNDWSSDMEPDWRF